MYLLIDCSEDIPSIERGKVENSRGTMDGEPRPKSFDNNDNFTKVIDNKTTGQTSQQE